MKKLYQLTSTLFSTLFSLATLLSAQAHAEADLYFIHSDHLGTPQVMTDNEQNVVWKTLQTPFGERVEETGSIIQPLRFPGQYADQESGLRYNYFRDYDPSLGRYVQSDPRGILFDFNDPQRIVAGMTGISIPYVDSTQINDSYTYVKNSPIGSDDKTGESVQVIVVLVALYTGYSVWKKIVQQEECEQKCKSDPGNKEPCEDGNTVEDGNTAGLTACKSKCVIEIWSTTFTRSPYPKRM
ncbi:Rhs family protein [Hahella chejuensis KCTC 2396]|uniref:Rhs family protein n=1 Tax=Hahella chejuensis (strain KCTC 2396) TaxID=349521 RepID=Q2SM81_HAHCH|nr:RHS repeat-associated core domain-containing protein [Hahella chejuensis]ABC28243.1 Rhs family protein [Hahella chejuensis KCTC 2396]